MTPTDEIRNAADALRQGRRIEPSDALVATVRAHWQDAALFHDTRLIADRFPGSFPLHGGRAAE